MFVKEGLQLPELSPKAEHLKTLIILIIKVCSEEWHDISEFEYLQLILIKVDYISLLVI